MDCQDFEFLDRMAGDPTNSFMDYDFSTLSHADFEDLTRDLIGQELGVRFEAFPEGPDDDTPDVIETPDEGDGDGDNEE